jgi:hypothetical protein
VGVEADAPVVVGDVVEFVLPMAVVSPPIAVLWSDDSSLKMAGVGVAAMVVVAVPVALSHPMLVHVYPDKQQPGPPVQAT